MPPPTGPVRCEGTFASDDGRSTRRDRRGAGGSRGIVPGQL